MNKELRGTGRTYRMLQYAIVRAKGGEYVLVYCDSPDQAINLTRQVLEMEESAELLGDPRLGAKLKIHQGSLSFERIGANFNWQKMRAEGVHPSVVTFVDHYAIERRFPEMSEILSSVGREILEHRVPGHYRITEFGELVLKDERFAK